ncbi:MAG: response regulator [Nitrospira sp.]|nr:response regulator [Nitrospira sp.]
MTIELDHTILPARDKEKSARFFADIFGLQYERSSGHFAPVKVNDRLTLDFDRDGAEAVKLVGGLRPHVMVMDINMSRMNGIDATTHIKTHWPETIVIGISVNTGDENSAAMKRAGATAVLPKETVGDQLYAVIVQETGVSLDKLTPPH